MIPEEAPGQNRRQGKGHGALEAGGGGKEQRDQQCEGAPGGARGKADQGSEQKGRGGKEGDGEVGEHGLGNVARGAQGFAEGAVRRLKSARQLQLGAYGGGLMIFFSDLGTPLILGPIFRPLFDRAGLLRARLSLILDATAAPIAILVPFIGWGVYIMSLVAQTPPGAGPEAPYALLLGALPFQFYAWLALALIPLLAFTGGHFGTRGASETPSKAPEPQASAAEPPEAEPQPHHPWQASLLWAPLAVLGIALFAMLGPEGFPFAPLPGADFRAGLAAAYALATATLVLLALALRILPFATLMESAITGATRMTPVAATLLMAWTRSRGRRSQGLGMAPATRNAPRARAPFTVA